jgi:hypothetical protein
MRHMQAIFHVDSRDEFAPWLKENGAEILAGSLEVTGGRI